MAEVTYGLRRIKQRLLDQPDLSIGASAVIPRPNDTATREAGNVVRLLDVNCAGKNSRDIIVTMGQFINDLLQPNSNSLPLSGPITGIVEWGNGGLSAYIEFDVPQSSRIPCDPFGKDNSSYPPSLASRGRTSGVSLSIAASSVRVSARNDNNLLGAEVAAAGTTIIGPTIRNIIDPTVFAHIAYGNSLGCNNGLLRKSIVLKTSATTELYAAGCGIPPFAKRVSFFRCGSSSDFNFATPAPAFSVSFYSNVASSNFTSYFIGRIEVPYGEFGAIDIPPGAAACLVVSGLVYVPCYRIVAVFDLAV